VNFFELHRIVRSFGASLLMDVYIWGKIWSRMYFHENVPKSKVGGDEATLCPSNCWLMPRILLGRLSSGGLWFEATPGKYIVLETPSPK
jgi:hypothetical protein